jgi:hypothetical protein
MRQRIGGTDMVVTESFNNVDELAAYCNGSTALFLVIGDREKCDSLIAEILPLINSSERIIHIPADSRLFQTLKPPSSFPALGMWSRAGALIGYLDQGYETVSDFVAYVRDYT